MTQVMGPRRAHQHLIEVPGQGPVFVYTIAAAATRLGILPISVKLLCLRGVLAGYKTHSRRRGYCWTWVRVQDVEARRHRMGL